MKKIIILAFDCNPYKESESLISFNTAKYLSIDNDITVITKSSHKDDIFDFMSENKNIHINFIFVDNEKYADRYIHAKGIFKILYLKKYANKWFESVNIKLRMLFKENNYDIIYRVTPNSFRIMPDLSEFTCKKILGPVGGAQEIPINLRCICKGKNKIIEFIHRKENEKILKNKKYIKKINDFDYIMCCNDETFIALKSIYNRDTIKCITDVGITENDINTNVKEHNKYVNFLWVGRFMFRKGLDLLIDVIKDLKDYNFKLTLVGNGPDLEHIKLLVNQYDLNDKVIFTGRVAKSEVNKYYRNCDVFLFPSLRESGGNVLAESLANGLPVIGLNIAGAKAIVPNNCGILINTNQEYNKIVNDFKEAIIYYINNGVSEELRKRCLVYAKNNLVWEIKLENLDPYLK